MAEFDVESPYDFRDPERARVWEAQIHEDDGWRRLFFTAIVAALSARAVAPLSVLELGSGPGHLARAILAGTGVQRYAALDYSSAMHALARSYLGDQAPRVQFAERDFRRADWMDGLGPFDVAVTMMAAHEVRRRDRLTPLFAQVAGLLNPGGGFLFADFYATEPAHDDLYLPREAQRDALLAAGFGTVTLLLDENGMALYAADRGPA
jgi:SAM-dependent methyltransferase